MCVELTCLKSTLQPRYLAGVQSYLGFLQIVIGCDMKELVIADLINCILLNSSKLFMFCANL